MDDCVRSGFQAEERYLTRVEEFFEFHDQNYCERNYLAIKDLLDRK